MASVPMVSAFLLLLAGPALAQAADPAAGETVTWAAPASGARQGEKISLTLTGAVQPGWHVYGLKQAPEGPTPLLVTLDQNSIAVADGAVAGSPAVKFHDPAFGVDTQFYEKAFTLTVPVRLQSHLATGSQKIPVSVRFQTCNGRICQPPKTIHLSALVNLQTGK